MKKAVKVQNRTLQVTNLDKVLYPDSDITKAEVIQYYLSIAPYFMRYSKYRPLSTVRYPDGIEGEMFFQKDLPVWRPDWLTFFSGGKEKKKNYVTVTEEATLVWLANLASLELHQFHFRTNAAKCPDYIVYDLDPPESFEFDDLKDLATSLKTYLESFGYHVYLKTSGNKGLHLFTPVLTNYSSDECFKAAKILAEGYVESNKLATLHLRKESRKGRVLIDIYRNRTSQTIVAPYSLRGQPTAPVSMPIHWDDLDSTSSSNSYTLRNIFDYLQEKGDAWEGMEAFAVPLHTHRTSKAEAINPPGDKHKSPDQLADYQQKRDFLKTSEPRPSSASGHGDAFVIHQHHASHVHYDLRLEKDGVLQSWAVPKGMPAFPGEKRLAVQTEDHPLAYLDFHGEIPKGEYGGGIMLIIARGRYRITKEKKGGFYFHLASPTLNGEFRIHQTNQNEWLLERVDVPHPPWLEEIPSPMLANQEPNVPVGSQWSYELKWDGIRAMLVIRDGELTIYSKNGRDISEQFPEIEAQTFHCRNGVYDGEIVRLDKEGKPDFSGVMKRLQASGKNNIHRLSIGKPACVYLFDVLFIDGIPVIQHPLALRRLILAQALKVRNGAIRISEMLEDGEELFTATREMGLEGIMCKDLEAPYSPGKRTNAWIKVKVREMATVEIIGYTRGKGSLDQSLGALHVCEVLDGARIYRGKVGTGLSDRKRTKLWNELGKQKSLETPPEVYPESNDERDIWLAEPVQARVRYAAYTRNGHFREPVFEGLITG